MNQQNSEIFIFDFDGTIIDSSHRALSHEDGSINLDHWVENCTKEKIFQDQWLCTIYLLGFGYCFQAYLEFLLVLNSDRYLFAYWKPLDHE